MFEGVVAFLLNKYLGRYVQDLDSQNLAVGIFGGTVQLTDLQLKTEALYELDLPIEVKAGSIGRLSIDIPWSSLYSDPVLVHVEDILILAGPCADRGFDPELDKRLNRALKKKRLDDAQEPALHQDLVDKPRSFFENLVATIVNNIQISVQNVHIRYEDSVTLSATGGGALCCGVALQGFTAITTNCKWKPTQVDGEAHRIFKLVKVESLSVYWNPDCPNQGLVKSLLPSPHWKESMKRGLATFSVGSQEFDFVVKPISAKAKVIFNKTAEQKVPKLLVDFVLQDAALQLSRQQYLSMLGLQESFQLMEVAQRYRRFRGARAPATARQWWAFAYTCVLEDRIRPFSWKRIKDHRARYRAYRSLYAQHLRRPTDAELRLDLQKAEDALDLVSILVARVQSKIKLNDEYPDDEDPDSKGAEGGGWTWWLSRFLGPWNVPIEESDDGNHRVSRHWRWEAERPLWDRLSDDERRALEEAIGLTEGTSPSQGAETSANYIAHKINFTLANCSASLVVGESEILVLTLTQFLSSLETRPGAGGAFKVSARAESFVVEGASAENDLLVPVVTADNVANGSALTHVFGLDFEKNPLHVNADFGLSINAEPIEVVYHEYAISQLLAFFQVPDFGKLQEAAFKGLKDLAYWSKAGLQYALSKHKTLHLSVDFKSPYLVIPEHGTVQNKMKRDRRFSNTNRAGSIKIYSPKHFGRRSRRGGSVLVVDMGRLTIKSDLQPTDNIPEEASRMDIEEQLYDRFSVTLADIQILFSDSGDEWRTAKQTPESEMHLMPKVRIQLLYSCSVKTDYRLLPRQKLNISLPSLKLCLSDRRLRLLVEFAQNLPLPDPKKQSSENQLDAALTVLAPKMNRPVTVFEPLDLRDIQTDPHGLELRNIRLSVLSTPGTEALRNSRSSTNASLPGSVQNFSDPSDDEPEEWARTVDLPGFDDNVSPSNNITMLFRFVIGEVVLHLSRSSDHADKPYLMFRMEKLCADAAVMDYGPAIQASLGGMQLIDKLHTGPSGEYLELLKSESKTDMFTLLYRKVQATCPEFRSHFHQVEHSLVLDLSSASVTFHRASFITLARFLLYISEKLKPLAKEEMYNQLVPDVRLAPSSLVAAEDPPVPSGATKFSISARMGQLKIKVCDTDLDFADVSVDGLECDYILKANEKMIVRLNLTDLTVEDLGEGTLYPKVLSIEDDRVFEFKYVKNSPFKEMEGEVDPCLPDGSLRLHVGRLHLVYLHRFWAELQRFMEPFLQPQATVAVIKKAEMAVHRQISQLQTQGQKLALSVEVHAPTLVVPQKSSSPNLLLFGLGDLSLENFFKDQRHGVQGNVEDNILLRLTSLQIARAIILLDGSIECQEPILEPVKLRLDVKRALHPSREGLAYDVRGSLDLIKVCIGQRDIGTVLSIYQENLSEADLSPFTPVGSGSGSPIAESPDPCSAHVGSEEEGSFRRLEAFLAAGAEVRKWASFKFNMEGLQVSLYTDAEEVLSSPVRDPQRSLSRFFLEEVGLQWEGNTDGSCEWKLSLQSLLLEDTRPDSALAIKRILHSYSSGSGETCCSGISISMPPVLDLTYRCTGHKDVSVNVTVDRTRLNLSVPYTLAVLKFLHDALPVGQRPHSQSPCQEDEDAADDVYECRNQNAHISGRPSSVTGQRCRLPSDSTSGYHSTHGGLRSSVFPSSGYPSMSVSACLKKPEIVIFADPTDANSQIVLLKTDILMEFSRTSGSEQAVLSVAGLHILSCAYRKKKDTMRLVLKPCDIELSRTRKYSEEEEEIKLHFSRLKLRLSPPVISTLLTVSQDYQNEIQTQLESSKSPELLEENSQEKQDLWSTRNVTPARWLRAPSVLVSRPAYPRGRRASQIFSINLPEISLNLETNLPLVFLRAALEADIHDWSKQVYMKSTLQLEAMYYNEKLLGWEPLLEPVLEGDSETRPFQVHLKMFREQAHPIAVRREGPTGDIALDAVDASAEEAVSAGGGSSITGQGSRANDSSAESSSEDEEESTVIRPRRSRQTSGRMTSQRSHDSCRLSALPPDSDSETEDNLLEKITSAFGLLFSGDSSDDDDDDDEDHPLNEETSDDGRVTAADDDIELDAVHTEGEDFDEEDDDDPDSLRPVFLIPTHRGEDVIDSGPPLVSDRPNESSLYWLLETTDPINFNITSRAIAVLWEVSEIFGGGGASVKTGVDMIHDDSAEKSLVLHNYLGPCTKIVVLRKDDTTGKYMVLEEAIGGSSPDSPPLGGTLEELEEQEESQLLVDLDGGNNNSSYPEDQDAMGDEADGFSIISAMSGTSSGCDGGGAGTSRVKEPLSFGCVAEEDDVADMYCRSLKERISIEVKGFDKFQCLVPNQAGSTLFSLHPCKNKTRYYFMLDADTDQGLKSITVRSPLQIENHLSRPMQVFCQKSSLEAVGACADDFARNPFHAQHVQLATLEADQVYCLPLLVAYHCQLFFQPAPTPADMQGYEVSREGIWWQKIETHKRAKFLNCPSRTHAKCDFWVKVVWMEDRQAKPVGSSMSVPNYTLHLYPPVKINNELPYGIDITIPKRDQPLRLEEGENIPLYDVHPQNSQEIVVELPQYQGCSWRGRLELNGQDLVHRTLSMTAVPDSCRRAPPPPPLTLGVHFSTERSLDVHLYAPFWLYNRTTMPLQAKGSSTDLVYELVPSTEPVLFRYKKHRPKKVKVRAYNTCKWSPSFSLDASGHQGVLACKDKERRKKYQFFTSIRGCRFPLSKAVTFQPFFNVLNNSKFDLRFMEENEVADLWIDLPAGQMLPYWPDTDSMRMFIKYRDSKIVSQHFSIQNCHTTVLRMDNGTALTLEVTGGQEEPVLIRFQPYSAGDAPVRVENLCEDLFIKIHQKSLGQVSLLNPYQSVLYTWDDPTAERVLVWDLYNRKKEGFHAVISRDGYGQERLSFRTLRRTPTVIQKRSSLDESSSDDDNSEEEADPLLPRRTRRDKVVVYWVSYLDSKRQRCLLFTQDERVARRARRSVAEEPSQVEFFASLNLIGLSLVSPTSEIAYVSCSGSPPIWEVEVHRSWKLLPLELSAWLEDKWHAGLAKSDLKDRFLVDLAKMQMLKPFFGALRRTEQPALWVQGRMSKHHRYLHLKMHRLQVDNQLPDAVFPTVLYPLATPQGVLRRFGPRPFLELQLLTHHQPRIDTIKFCKLLVQEVSLKLDRGFLLSVIDCISLDPEKLTELNFPSSEMAKQTSDRIVFEYLHLSPIKLHLSFSPRGNIHGKEPFAEEKLWTALGAAMTEFKDVQIKMAYFERVGWVSTCVQMKSAVWRHYLGQVLQQIHVLLLGLHVLGNPYGLVRDFTRGVKDFFYEPALGAVQSPEEFSGRLADGAKSLLGHVVGGSAGAISLIAESLGQVLSSLSCDQEYRKKRQRRLRQQRDAPGTMPEGLVLAGRGMAQGVALGISGIVLQPITGAQQEGLEGFFKGAGKGILGLITKPAGGVIDMVSMAFDSVRRAAELGEQVVPQMRLPRHINPNQGLKPYMPYEALGLRLLQSLNRGCYAETDVYWAHAALSTDSQAEVVLLTDRHLFLLEPRRGWAKWDVQWFVRTDDLVSIPEHQENKLIISVREDDASRTGLENGISQRTIQCRDKAVLAWIRSRVERVLLANMQGRPCTQCV